MTQYGAPARGAVVTITDEDHPQLRVIDAGSGYLCQMEPVAHFGLGKRTSVGALRVQWPGNVCVTVYRPAINSVLRVEYPQRDAHPDTCSCDAVVPCTQGE